MGMDSMATTSEEPIDHLMGQNRYSGPGLVETEHDRFIEHHLQATSQP